MPKALWWFRWSSVVTVLGRVSPIGSTWPPITPARQSPLAKPASAGRCIGSFVLIWTLAFAVEMGVLMSPAEVLRKGPVLGIIMASW